MPLSASPISYVMCLFGARRKSGLPVFWRFGNLSCFQALSWVTVGALPWRPCLGLSGYLAQKSFWIFRLLDLGSRGAYAPVDPARASAFFDPRTSDATREPEEIAYLESPENSPGASL
eukprot:8684111-Pyramimonas_sp.AAC.1